MIDREAMVELAARAREECIARVPARHHEMTGERGAGGAHGQMWRSCVLATPERLSRNARTACGSIPAGTASSERRKDSRNRLHELHRIAAATTRLAIGSASVQPVSRITMPATTTAADTAASPTR